MNKQKPTLLITGGAGFIGANFVAYYLHQHPNCQIINLDKLTYAGTLDNLDATQHANNHQFIHGDVADKGLLQRIFSDNDIVGVIHLAAESHVDRSIHDVTPFIESNVVGTAGLLDVARQAWGRQGVEQERRFHYVSTDEIYGSLGQSGEFDEQTPYNPRNPYSATKASANLLVKSFGYTYGMNVVISSSSNNYGPHQHEEKLIPTIIRKALKGETIPIYGDGQHKRDWLHVYDHCRALEHIFHDGNRLETYNIGGRNERTNNTLAHQICDRLDDTCPHIKSMHSLTHFAQLITHTEDRLGHDHRYAVNDQKIRTTLGWQPKISFNTGLNETIDWYVKQWTPVAQ